MNVGDEFSKFYFEFVIKIKCHNAVKLWIIRDEENLSVI